MSLVRRPVPIALTIAGSDPSGGAGLQADLKTFHQHRVYGMAVVSLLTVQSTRAVRQVQLVDPALLDAQLTEVLADVPPGAIKTGALGSAAAIDVVATRLAGSQVPLVVDPVMVSKHGHALLESSAQRVLVERLFSLAALVTPNAHEAAALLGVPVQSLAQARDAARRLGDRGPAAVLVKGGHLEGPAIDVLWHAGQLHELPGDRLDTPHTHGTGCTLSAAITARLAQGLSLPTAVEGAKAWLSRALRTPPAVGLGVGPVDHLAELELSAPDVKVNS